MMRLQMAGTDGIIPAYAGNTPIVSCICPQAWDHPRVCGEHPNTANSRYMSRGSSPRMRGTHVGHDHVGAVRGIIPAYAGNTAEMVQDAQDTRDHPRVCGEHIGWGFIGGTSKGSSPRMRGTLGRRLFRFRSVGIIPAYAGNTLKRDTASPSTRDHPRVCGEHFGAGVPVSISTGSSPRMRGTLKKRGKPMCVIGIIPAYAGNTHARRSRNSTARDHPRVCGEHLFRARRATYIQGSSPRMRGTRGANPRRAHRMGIIPAYAGNTPRPHDTCPATRDHPRVCGEHEAT